MWYIQVDTWIIWVPHLLRVLVIGNLYHATGPHLCQIPFQAPVYQ